MDEEGPEHMRTCVMKNLTTDLAFSRQSLGGVAKLCALLPFACGEDEEDALAWQARKTLPCGHALHPTCLLEYLRTSCLGMAAAGSTADRHLSVAVMGAVCPALDGSGARVCQEPIPWLELLDGGFFGTDTAQVRYPLRCARSGRG